MPKYIDIVDLIEKNPIVRLSKDYQNELITKVKSRFTNKEQQLFVSSFFCYLNYNSKKDLELKLPRHIETLIFKIKVFIYSQYKGCVFCHSFS